MYLDQHTHFFLHEPRLLFRGPGDGAADRFLSHTPVEGVAQLPDSPDHPQFRQLVQRLLQEANVLPPPHQDEPAPPTQEELDRRAVSELKNLRHQEGDVRRRAVRFLLQWMRGKSPQDLTDLTQHARHAEDLDELRHIVARPEIQESHQYSFKKIATMIQATNGFLRDVWRVIFEDRVKAEVEAHGFYSVIDIFLSDTSQTHALGFFPWKDMREMSRYDATKSLNILGTLLQRGMDDLAFSVAEYFFRRVGDLSPEDFYTVVGKSRWNSPRTQELMNVFIVRMMNTHQHGYVGNRIRRLAEANCLTQEQYLLAISSLLEAGSWKDLQSVNSNFLYTVFRNATDEQRMKYSQQLVAFLQNAHFSFDDRLLSARQAISLHELSTHAKMVVAAFYAVELSNSEKISVFQLDMIKELAEVPHGNAQIPRFCRKALKSCLGVVKEKQVWKKDAWFAGDAIDIHALRHVSMALAHAGSSAGLELLLEQWSRIQIMEEAVKDNLIDKNEMISFSDTLKALDPTGQDADVSKQFVNLLLHELSKENLHMIVDKNNEIDIFRFVCQAATSEPQVRMIENILFSSLRKDWDPQFFFYASDIRDLEERFGRSLEAALPDDLRKKCTADAQYSRYVLAALSHANFHSEEWNNVLVDIFLNERQRKECRDQAIQSVRLDRAVALHLLQILEHRIQVPQLSQLENAAALAPFIMEKLCHAYNQQHPAVGEDLLENAMDAYIVGMRHTDYGFPIKEFSEGRMIDFCLENNVLARIIAHDLAGAPVKARFLEDMSLHSRQHPAFKRALVAGIYDEILLAYDKVSSLYDTTFLTIEGFEKLPEVVRQHKDHPQLTTDCLARLAFANGWPQIAQVLVDIHRGTTLPEDRQQSLARQLRAISEKYPHLTDLATYIRQNNALGK